MRPLSVLLFGLLYFRLECRARYSHVDAHHLKQVPANRTDVHGRQGQVIKMRSSKNVTQINTNDLVATHCARTDVSREAIHQPRVESGGGAGHGSNSRWKNKHAQAEGNKNSSSKSCHVH